MPLLSFSTPMTASQLGLNPIIGWQYEYAPWPAVVKLLLRATTVSARLTLYTGSTTIQQRSPIQGGGTAGTTPSDLNTNAILFMASAGDRIIPQIDEVSGLTPTIDGVIFVEPA